MASDSTPIRFRSKKPFASASKTSDENVLSSKSPQQPTELLPRRTRNRGVALSIKEVRMVAESLRQSNRDLPSAEMGSSQKEILESGSSVQKPNKMGNGSPELPEKYETLIQFFNALVNSIRLSKLKLTTPLFTNLCVKIKVLTERNFTYHHLAQLKYILPEAIELKKMMVMDEQTYCTKPNLHISLNANAIETTKDKNMNLQKVFRSRLLEFIKTHPEGDEVPADSLPEPFDQLRPSSKLSAQTSKENDGILKSSSLHLSQSFKQRFSRNMARTITEKNHHAQSEIAAESSSVQEISNSLATPTKVNFSIQSSSPSMETPIKETGNLDSTPAKLVSTPVQTMLKIRASQATKRSLNIPKDDSENSLNKLVRRPPRSRTLQFSDEDNGKRQKEGTCYSEGVLDVLSDSLLQSIREKEQKLIEEKDPAISLAKRRRKIMENLPKRFDTIRHLFRSLNRSVMTKQELVYKIVTNCSDIVDRVEAEEELGILIELAPEWIMEKSASTGDVIICIKKSSNADEIRKRLTEAK